MLGHSEIAMEVSDVGMETAESDDCREISKNNRNTNSVLAMMWKGARFSHKYRWKFIDLFV